MKLARFVKVLSLSGPVLIVMCVQALSGTVPERQELLARIEALQANPLAPDAKEQGAWIVKWLIDSKDVSVTLCADLTVSLTQKDDDVGGVLTVHSLLGAAKYALTVPAGQQ